MSFQFKTLFAYHWHTTKRLMEGATKLAPADYRHHPGYGHGSVHDLLFHILRTDYGWRIGLKSGQQPEALRSEDFSTLKSLKEGFEHEQKEWQILLDKLTTEELKADMQLTSRGGRQMSIARWRILQHVVLHGMQHHTEIAQLLTAKGQSPGDIDFIFFD